MDALPDKYTFNGPVGEQRSFSHAECGDTRSRLYVRRVHGGFLYHCHNCDPPYNGFQPTSGILSPSQIKQVLAQPKKVALQTQHGKVYLPQDATHEIPQYHVLWLSKWLSEAEIKDFGIRYSPSLERLIFPMYIGSELVYWQARTLDKTIKPKWKNPRVPKDFVLSIGSGDPVVLVEAFISAIVVGRYTEALPLIGSYVTPPIVQYLKTKNSVCLWLDPDKKKSSIIQARNLRAVLGKNIKIVLSDKKPRNYSEKDILEMISHA